MSIETKTLHITPVGGNIFADLGFEPGEAARLLAETDHAISEKLAIKESLMTELAGWIETKKLKQDEAAEILGITRLRVSDVICRGQSETGSNLTTRKWMFFGRLYLKLAASSLCGFSSVFFRVRVVAGVVTWRETRHGTDGEAALPELRRVIHG